MSLRVALRTDGCFADVCAWAAKHGFGGFAVRENADGDNPHEHWVLFCGTKTIKSVRSSFNREVPELRGNGKYSMSEIDDLDKYTRYMCKGGSDCLKPLVVWRDSMTYDDAKIQELHEAYWKENKSLKRKRGGSMIDKVVDEAKRQNVHYGDRRALAKVYIRLLKEECKPINLFSIRANLNAVQVALCPDDSVIDSLVDRLEQF